MGPKKPAGDGEDLSCEKFYAKYKKECTLLGFKPAPQVVEKYQNEYLENGSNLMKFNLWDEMGWQGVKALMDSMRVVNYQHTQSIRLWSTGCEDEGCRAICRYIQICPSVIVLELLQNNITSLGCQFIDHNPIGSEGMAYLAEGLRQNKNITLLSLTYCNIDKEGAQSIFEVLLFQGSVLEEIDLGGNHLRDEGSIQVLKGSAAAKTLKKLGLQDNQFMQTEEVLDAIQFCMEKNKELTKYNFKYNFISDDGVDRICDIMAIADHVSEVQIPERISKDIMEKFQAATLANKPKKGKGGKGKKKKK